MSDLKVAVYPAPIQWGNKEANLSHLEEICEKIHPEADILVLPETFSTGFPSGDKEEIRPLAERNTGRTIDFIKELAKKHNMAIAGSFIADSGGLLFNRAFFIEPDGEETFADKKHLFTMAREHERFSSGTRRLSVRYRGWNIAMIVCYDIRFPVWCRNVDNEYDLLLAVANWPDVRVDAWNKLLYARAIENESYVCGVNCKGTDIGGFNYDGSSAIIDFKGKEVSVASQDGILYAVLSKEKLERFREKFPAWKDSDKFTFNEK